VIARHGVACQKVMTLRDYRLDDLDDYLPKAGQK
jgi:hypothetical protein